MSGERELSTDEATTAIADAARNAVARFKANQAEPVVVYCDTETGGTLPQHPTIQLAAVAMRGDVELSSFEQKIAFLPGDCDPEALKMNHYTPEAWADAVSTAKTAARFSTWLRPFCEVERIGKFSGKPYKTARVAGYNYLTFDGPRIREQIYSGLFCQLDYLARDVLQRVLFYFDESGETPPENFKLTTVAAHFGIEVDAAHDALFDARLSARVYAAVKGRW